MNSAPKDSPDKELVKAFEAAGVVEFLEYVQSGKRVMWVNFKAGVAKGFGITIGMSLVVGGLIWVLTMLVGLPVVGEYFEEAEKVVTDYAENTNYSDEFLEMNRLLSEINDNVQAVDESSQSETVPETGSKQLE